MNSIPYLCDGEIRNVHDFTGEKKNTVTYEILVRLGDGSETFLYDVPAMSAFGGISDFSHTRYRGTADDESSGDATLFSSQGRYNSVGDKVIVAFLSGDMRRPIIVGFYPHPKRPFDLPDAESDQPQTKLAYLGMEVDINPAGETLVTHRGAPAVSFDGSIRPEEIEQTGPTELPERAIEEAQPFESHQPTLPEKSQTLIDDGIETTEPYDGLVYPDAQYTTQMGFLEKGEWFVTDSEGQQVFMDRDTQTISITNGDEIIQIDKANKTIFFKTTGNFEIQSDLDEVKNIGGNKHLHVEGDEIKKVNANVFDTTEGNISKKTTGNYEEKIQGKWQVESEGEYWKVAMKSKNTIYLDDRPGKESIFLIHNTGAQISISSKGNIMLLSKAGDNISLSADSGTITVQPSKGGLLSINDKILMSDASGKQMISITDSNVEVNASAQVTLSCKSVSLNCGDVALGAQATMSSVVGENLIQWLSTHSHVTPVGPSGPPIILPSVFTGTPLDILSKYVKIRPNI
jgi:uncharacterized protein YxjI